MKSKTKSIIIISLLTCLFFQCKKTENLSVEDPHNHSLLKKSLAEIQAEIAGRWQIKRTRFYVCGVAGCDTNDTSFIKNDGDLVSFLSNDTVSQTGFGGFPIKIYEKAMITKVSTRGTLPVDSVYNYIMANGYYSWAIAEIKNDSLVIFAGVDTHYLTRKP